MVGVVDLVDEAVVEGQDDLVEVKGGVEAISRQAQLGGEILQDVGHLAEDEVAVAEEGRCQEGGVAWLVVGHDANDLLDGLVGAGGLGGVGVGHAGLFEEKADELTTAGETGPVDELEGVAESDDGHGSGRDKESGCCVYSVTV